MVNLQRNMSVTTTDTTCQSCSTTDTGITENGYTGSSFASLLVIILFEIWFLYRMGKLSNQ
ncbi:hypothetical protein [Turicibacter sanguinis]|uniref:hypothetical protein n=1 Tax=Turicibacter sanguinis TaxID=154288 RepID=UPI0039999D6B